MARLPAPPRSAPSTLAPLPTSLLSLRLRPRHAPKVALARFHQASAGRVSRRPASSPRAAPAVGAARVQGLGPTLRAGRPDGGDDAPCVANRIGAGLDAFHPRGDHRP